MKKTRLDLTTRKELLANRLEYLDNEIAKLQTEHKYIMKELEIIDSLYNLYSNNPTDAIDDGRKSVFIPRETDNVSRVQKGKEIRRQIIDLLPAKTTELCDALDNIKKSNVSIYLSRLKKKGLIANDSNNVWHRI